MTTGDILLFFGALIFGIYLGMKIHDYALINAAHWGSTLRIFGKRYKIHRDL